MKLTQKYKISCLAEQKFYKLISAKNMHLI